MSRKNLYDIIATNKMTPTAAFSRIRYYFDHEEYATASEFGTTTMRYFVGEYIFPCMPVSSKYIDLNDFLRDIGLYNVSGEKTFDDVFLFIEFILLVIDSTPKNMAFRTTLVDGGNIYDDILVKIQVVLNETNHEIKEVNGHKIVLPKDYVVDQAAMLVSDTIAYRLYEYNHFSNNGNMEGKRAILKAIADYIEPILQKKKGDQVAILVSDMLNNLNIRHNNLEGSKKKAFITKMDDELLEQWYDKTYNAIVYLLISNEWRKTKTEYEQLKGDAR